MAEIEEFPRTKQQKAIPVESEAPSLAVALDKSTHSGRTMNQRIQKRLLLEGLERRQCFSADIGAILADLEVPSDVIELVRHNHQQPTDVNVDGRTTPTDALNVINELNLKSAVAGSVGTINSSMMTDTNGDKRVSPADALIVINYLNEKTTQVEITTEELSSDSDAAGQPVDQFIRQIIAKSQASQESVATLLGRLRDQGLIDIGAIDLESLNYEWFASGTHEFTDGSIQDALFADPATMDARALKEFFSQSSIDVGSSWDSSNDVALLSNNSDWGVDFGRTYDPTEDNGNGFFLSPEASNAIRESIEAELRKQLKLDESANVQVAVYVGGDEVQSGTWKYLTGEGITIWGNWRKTTTELRLFLSNVEEENRIYGQYPDGSFLYFSWLEGTPVGFYFTPTGAYGVQDPVPTERYTVYFSKIPGSYAMDFGDASLIAFAGDLPVFAGVQPIEGLLSDLFAIQNQWNEELLSRNS